jgi:hypothetical protein
MAGFWLIQFVLVGLSVIAVQIYPFNKEAMVGRWIAGAIYSASSILMAALLLVAVFSILWQSFHYFVSHWRRIWVQRRPAEVGCFLVAVTVASGILYYLYQSLGWFMIAVGVFSCLLNWSMLDDLLERRINQS